MFTSRVKCPQAACSAAFCLLWLCGCEKLQGSSAMYDSAPLPVGAGPQATQTALEGDAGSLAPTLDAAAASPGAQGSAGTAATRGGMHASAAGGADAASDEEAGTEPGAGSNAGSGGPPPFNCGGEPYSAYVSDPRMCVTVFASGLGAPRQMAFASNGDLFVNNGELSLLWDADHDGHSDSGERATFASQPGLGHGVALDRAQRFVYASSASAVHRWPYEAGMRQAQDDGQTVVRDIPSSGHSTRSLAFDSQGRLYVSIGSAANLDTEPELWQTRSLIRRFDLSNVPADGLPYSSGELVASGLRNEVGLYIDAQDRLWGVDNERDSLSNDGGDIHNDNPAEEINLIDGQGTTFYGYPFCYSEFRLQGGQGAGTQWADTSLPDSARKSDAWCRDPSNVRAPAFAMQAHYAPLGITEYTGSALPFTGDFIITSHGSWNRSPAVGRLLLRAHRNGDEITEVTAIVGERSDNGELTQGSWDARPVDVQQGPDQAIYFSDDLRGRVFKLGYR